MRQSATKLRRRIQHAWNSRLGTRQPSVLVNSIPKSGTHLVIEVLQGAGHTFCGHHGDTEHHLLEMTGQETRYFSTAHISKPVTGPGLRLLVYRDPVDVAFSLAFYIRSRVDHPRHAKFVQMNIEEAIQDIFDGDSDQEPLAQRFVSMFDWAKSSQARLIDFKTCRDDPAALLTLLGIHDYDTSKIHSSLNKKNPTKRDKKPAFEKELKSTLRNSDEPSIRSAFDVYQEIKSHT